MIFVTGPLFAGKQEYIMETLGWAEADFEAFAVRDVQDLAAELDADGLRSLADRLAEKKVVIATEVGGGVGESGGGGENQREQSGKNAANGHCATP
jgi:adenosylcobinamide kinase/adenosylcobinamide-phosphate guanylyltransferase